MISRFRIIFAVILISLTLIMTAWAADEDDKQDKPVFDGPIGQIQNAPSGGYIVIPESSIEKPGDAGVRAHTNVEIYIPPGDTGHLQPPSPLREAHPGEVKEPSVPFSQQ